MFRHSSYLSVLFMIVVYSAAFCEGFVARDKVQLKNGRLLEGIISQQTDEYITITIEGGAEIKISRDTIQYIKSASLESIQKAEEFQKEQQQKGLISYKGEWLTPEIYEVRKTRDSLAEEVEALRQSKEKVLKELSQLKESRRYESQPYKFSFNPPQEWKQTPVADSSAVCLFENNQGDDFNEFVRVSVVSKTDEVIDQEFIDTAIKGLEEEKEGYLNKLRSFDVVTVDGLNALKIVLSRYFFKQNTNPENIDDPFHQKLLVYVVIGMTKMYKIELSCLVNDFNQYADIFEQCIKSFLIYDRESAAPQTSAVESTVQSEEPERQFSDTDKPIYEQISQSSLETEEFSHDKVYLKNKRILAGTIVQETNETIRIRVEELSSPEYFITIPKDSIENIEWMSEQERQDKLQKEEELRQKGYVKFYGHWISKDERNQFYLKAEEEQEELLRYNNENISQSQEEISQQIFNEQLAQKDEEIKELLVQLRLLEEENEKLKSELEHQQNVTNEKLDEFLERERQEVPTGKVAEITRNSIVKVMVRSKYAYSDSYQSSASGAVLDSRGTIITNYYIGKNPFREEWFVEYKDEEYQTKILEYDPILDVAIIRINVQGLEPITIGDADKIQQGDQIINVGAPLGYRDSFTVGRVLSTSGVLTDLFDVNVRLRWNIERTYGQPEISILKKKFESDYGTVYMIQHNAITYAQNNGGPLLNKDGALIGINQNTNFRGSISAVLPASTQGFNMAVSINSLKKQPKFASYLR